MKTFILYNDVCIRQINLPNGVLYISMQRLQNHQLKVDLLHTYIMSNFSDSEAYANE